MKILLLNPPFFPKFSRSSRSPAVTKGGTIYYPILLASTTGVLEKKEFDVKLVDAPSVGYSLNDILKIVKEFNPKLTVIDTSTPSIFNDIKVAEEIKKITNTFITLVGTHVSALPEETLKLSDKIDAVAKMEYDYTIRDLAHTLNEGKNLKSVLGLIFREKGKIIHNQDRPFIENLDEIPFVSSVYKKYLDTKNYFFASAEYPMIMIMTGRGCPFKCFFCNYPQVFYGKKYRLRSPENVVAEFEYIIKNFPDVKEIGIEDDTFSADLKRVHEICELLIKKELNKKIKWWANTRVNLDLETMKLMKMAGCRLIIPGYESGVQEILDNVHKGITIEQSLQFSKNAKKAGLLVHGCFIFGLPGETKETVRKTIEFAKKLNPDTAQFFPLMVYPGTEAYEWSKKNNYLLTENYSMWLTQEGLHNTVISSSNLTNKELIEFCDLARKEFYLRKEYIFRLFKQAIFHPSEFKRIFKSAKTFFKYLFRGSFA
jgi:radical SAM superfamily enzyme YgiQ (UPF0313 family)